MSKNKSPTYVALIVLIVTFLTACATKKDKFNDVADFAENVGDYKFAKSLRNMSKYQTGYTPVMAKYVADRRIPGVTEYIRPAWVQERLDAEANRVKSGHCSAHLNHLIEGTDLLDTTITEASLATYAQLRRLFHIAGANQKWLGMNGSILTQERYEINKKAIAKNDFVHDTDASKALHDAFRKLVADKDLFLNYQPTDFNTPGKAIRDETEGIPIINDISNFWFARDWIARSMYSDLLWSAFDINLECIRKYAPNLEVQ